MKLSFLRFILYIVYKFNEILSQNFLLARRL
jgi:hypothetical protein